MSEKSAIEFAKTIIRSSIGMVNPELVQDLSDADLTLMAQHLIEQIKQEAEAQAFHNV